jgi:hypothetical protein
LCVSSEQKIDLKKRELVPLKKTLGETEKYL